MDANSPSVQIVALLTTLIGALLGPYALDWLRHRQSLRLRGQTTRENPYIDFATAVERAQLDLDLMTKGSQVHLQEFLSHFRAMEESRSRLDLVGTQSARVWAYRCRIAMTSMCRHFSDPERRNFYRLKLHQARAEFVTYARAEVGLTTDRSPHPVHMSEDSATGHAIWIEGPVDDKDTINAVTYAVDEFADWTLPAEQADGQSSEMTMHSGDATERSPAPS